ncbi:MAG: hypothetical protein V1746_08780, partial [bacterium]
SLDVQTRSQMQEVLLDVWEKEKTTVLFITHDIEEAIFLADRVYVMSAKPGEIKEEMQIPFSRPRNSEIKLSEEFLAIKRQIHYAIRGESPKATQSGSPIVQTGVSIFSFLRKTLSKAVKK